ncbi:hypothetical protein C2845_PM06G05100 [Panicum miliaceum]|uniref:Bifunctional inhibitor/plant lipid transfer protein/seed storage helical domain-containing protein n=1 Tax=Panicum miliaceum TaxID=4540 RepID=A0A3L6R9F8_PANMI|nr:hypothetical protein C2845_PM06G05100 [Panicum miliaceum]
MAGARVAGAYLCCLIVVLAASCPSSRSYELESKDDIMRHCRHFMEKHLGNGEPHPHSECCKFVRQANVAEICHEFTEAAGPRSSCGSGLRSREGAGTPWP